MEVVFIAVKRIRSRIVVAAWQARVHPFNVDPSNGPMDAFPVCESYSPHQVCTQTGTAVIDSTTRAGLFIILPNWAEKVLGWHYPMDPTTSTFGAPEAIYFSLDVDQFYERYRLVTSTYAIQAGTVSTTNAALSGSLNAVKAYNSLSSLQGNGSSVFQIYSYGNALGLTPDPTCRQGAIPSWKGVGMVFINNPRRAWARLEDSSNFTPSSDVDAAECKFKFVDTSNSYDLTCQIPFALGASTTISGAAGAATFFTGKVLMDAVRASSISWAFEANAVISTSGVGSTNNFVEASIEYYMLDIAGVVKNSGYLHREILTVTGSAGSAIGAATFNRSGSFPTILNIDETSLQPPIRSIEFKWQLRRVGPAPAGNIIFTWTTQPVMNATIPINNGMVEGLIQNPFMVTYDGVEIGTKLTVLGNLRLETIADSATAKFVTPLYRKVDMDTEQAIIRVLSNPAKFGVRFVVPLDTLQDQISLINSSINLQIQEGVDQVRSVVEHLMNLARVDSTLPKREPFVEASVKSVWKKAMKGLKNVAKSEYEDLVKPILHESMTELKKLPRNAVNRAIEASLATAVPTASTYTGPSVKYTGLNQNQVNTRASSGWPGPRACTAPLGFEPEGYWSAGTKKVADGIVAIDDDDETPIIARVHIKEASLFPCVYTDADGEFTEMVLDKKKTVAALFAVTTFNNFAIPGDTPKTKVGSHWVWNYSATKIDPEISPIDPGKNVILLRVLKISDDGEYLDLVMSRPITGRSLDLAFWAFSRKIGPGIVFTGAVENGKVLSLPYSTSFLKKLYVVDTLNMPLCGNLTGLNLEFGLIDVKTLAEVGPKIVHCKTGPMRISSTHWHALSDLDLNYVFSKINPTKDSIPSTNITHLFYRAFDHMNHQFKTYFPENLTVYALVDRPYEIYFFNYPDTWSLPFKRTELITKREIADVIIHDYKVLLTIGESHAFYKLLAAEILPEDYEFLTDAFGNPIPREIPPLPSFEHYPIPVASRVYRPRRPLVDIEDCVAPPPRAAVNIRNQDMLMYLLEGIYGSNTWNDYKTADEKEKKKYKQQIYNSLHAMFLKPNEEIDAKTKVAYEKAVRFPTVTPRKKDTKPFKAFLSAARKAAYAREGKQINAAARDCYKMFDACRRGILVPTNQEEWARIDRTIPFSYQFGDQVYTVNEGLATAWNKFSEIEGFVPIPRPI